MNCSGQIFTKPIPGILVFYDRRLRLIYPMSAIYTCIGVVHRVQENWRSIASKNIPVIKKSHDFGVITQFAYTDSIKDGKYGNFLLYTKSTKQINVLYLNTHAL